MSEERLTPGTAGWQRHGVQHLQRYQFAGTMITGRRVLDLACGVGYGSYTLAQLGAQEVLGVDRDAAAIGYATRTYRHPALQFTCADALTWTAPAGFDVITSFETIEHLPDPAAFVGQLARALRPGGRLIISAPNTLQYQRGDPPVVNPFHLSEPTYDQFRGWLEPGFQIVAEWEQSPVQPSLAYPQMSYDQAELSRRSWLRLFNQAEALLRRALGRRLPRRDPPRPAPAVLVRDTEMLPLLPERRGVCDVFVFVCERRD